MFTSAVGRSNSSTSDGGAGNGVGPNSGNGGMMNRGGSSNSTSRGVSPNGGNGASAIGKLRPSLPGDALTHLLFDAGVIGAGTIEPVARLRRHRGRAEALQAPPPPQVLQVPREPPCASLSEQRFRPQEIRVCWCQDR